MLGHLHMPLALQRLIPEEEIDGPLALIFIVLPRWGTELMIGTRTRGQGLAHIGQQLLTSVV